MRTFSLPELILSFVAGAGLVGWGILLFAIHAECSCHLDVRPTDETMVDTILLLMGFLAIWTLGVVIAFVRERVE